MSHSHSTAHASSNRLRIVLILTASYMIVEIAGGVVTGSLALLADAGHVFIDVTGMSIALVAISFGARSPTLDKTYGFYRLEILAALVNGVLMVGIGAFILFEAARRFSAPPDLPGLAMLAFAVPGLLVNLTSGFLLLEGQKASLNLRGAFLEVVSDLAGSAAVVLAGTVIFAIGFKLIDPIASLAIGLFILPRTWNLMSEAVHVLLEGVPRNVNLSHIQEHILSTSGVVGVHDLHVWNLTSGMNVMSAHVVVSEDAAPGQVLEDLCGCLDEHFDIEHSTFQIEHSDRREREHAGH